MNIDFKKKRVLVTGAGRGIGRDLVKKLVECNAQVVAVARTQANLESLKEEVPTIEIVAVDLSDWDAAEKAVTNIGPIDLLVNNAGVGILSPIGTITSELCDKTFDINVKAMINVTQVVAKGMKERGQGGSIVNVSSQNGLVALKDHLVYGASKGAVDQITKGCALDLGPYQIRCNAVCPTVILTEMSKKNWEGAKGDDMIAKIPLGHFAETEDVVNAIIYLLSDKSAMINGVLLPIDGGFTAT